MFEWNWKHIYLLEIGKDNSKSIFQPATCLFTWVLNSIHLSLVHLNNVGVPPFNKDLERSIGLVLSTDANVILCHLPGDIFFNITITARVHTARLWHETSRRIKGKAGLSKSKPCWNELTLAANIRQPKPQQVTFTLIWVERDCEVWNCKIGYQI